MEWRQEELGLMIIVRYCGGLGNQMYQYAMQVALEKRFPQQQFKADVFHYNLLKEHNGFELEHYFGIRLEYASRREIKHVYAGLVPGEWWKFLPWSLQDFVAHNLQGRYLRMMECLKPKLAARTVKEANLSDMIDSMETGDWYVKGMWQNVALFEDYQQEIASAFHLAPDLSEEEQRIVAELTDGQAIAVHVRGGDFLKGSLFNLCGKEYYEKALTHFSKDIPLYVFTDDTSYASTLLKECSVKAYVSHRIEESIKDLYMMSCAKYQIVSNSTFSFWSGFLNVNASTVVCPKYATKMKTGFRDASCKSNWIVLDNRK